MNNSFVKNTAYALLDLVTLKKGVVRTINGMKIRFPARWSRYYPADYENENYLFLQKTVKPGWHLIDIGAHFGLFSTCASQLTGPKGKIICFEPTPVTFSILKKTLALNHCDNVTPIQAAVSDKEGTATFYMGEMDGCNSNSLIDNNMGGGGKSGYEIKTVTIDGIVSENAMSPDLIKVDAEGAELEVLKGAIKTLEKYKPIVIIGLHPFSFTDKPATLGAIWDLVISIGYKIRFNRMLITRSDFCSRTGLFEIHCETE